MPCFSRGGVARDALFVCFLGSGRSGCPFILFLFGQVALLPCVLFACSRGF